MAPVIEVHHLSKKYRLGTTVHKFDRITEFATRSIKKQWQTMRGRQIVAPKAEQWIWGLNDINFEIQMGEVVGVIGANGAGKSTLLKILSRITDPTSGYVWLRGRASSLLEVGTGFHPDLTGRENIFLNGSILGMSRVEVQTKLDEIVAFSEIGDFLDTPVKRYSSGMYIRLAFAVAAHLDPEVLIIDEVLAVGDMAFQKKCLGKMGEASRAGRTVLRVVARLTVEHFLQLDARREEVLLVVELDRALERLRRWRRGRALGLELHVAALGGRLLGIGVSRCRGKNDSQCGQGRVTKQVHQLLQRSHRRGDGAAKSSTCRWHVSSRGDTAKCRWLRFRPATDRAATCTNVHDPSRSLDSGIRLFIIGADDFAPVFPRPGIRGRRHPLGVHEQSRRAHLRSRLRDARALRGRRGVTVARLRVAHVSARAARSRAAAGIGLPRR